jgi:hypothetical protein
MSSASDQPRRSETARPQNQIFALLERTNTIASESSCMRRSAHLFLLVNSNVVGVGEEEDFDVEADMRVDD